MGNHLGRPLSPELLEKVVAGSGFEGMKKTYDKIEKASDKGKFLTKAAGQMSFMQKGLYRGLKLKRLSGAGLEGVTRLRRSLSN